MAETRRVILASGEVREASVEPAVAYGYMAPLSEVRGYRATRIGEGTVHAPSEAMGDTAEDAVTRLASHNGWSVREILAPGEPTRAEIAAQLAAVTRERDVALGQIGPLLDAHDALVAAARAAGWTGAGATGAELVVWVRRGEREACADAITARLAEAVREVREKTYRGTGAERDTAAAVRDAIEAVRDMIREGGE